MSKQKRHPHSRQHATSKHSATPANSGVLASNSIDSSSLDNATSTGEKELAYYTALINAWIGTRMEQDKSLLSLAAAGIGLLVTLSSTIGARSRTEAILFSLAIVSFLATTLLIVYVFRQNADLLYGCITESEGTTKHLPRRLKLVDTLILCFFFSGILLSAAIGVAQVFKTWNTNGLIMADQDNRPKRPLTQDEIKSLAGIEKLRPTTPEPKPSAQSGQGTDNSAGASDSGQNDAKEPPKPQPKK